MLTPDTLTPVASAASDTESNAAFNVVHSTALLLLFAIRALASGEDIADSWRLSRCGVIGRFIFPAAPARLSAATRTFWSMFFLPRSSAFIDAALYAGSAAYLAFSVPLICNRCSSLITLPTCANRMRSLASALSTLLPRVNSPPFVMLYSGRNDLITSISTLNALEMSRHDAT